jgi:hypothetical protein
MSKFEGCGKKTARKSELFLEMLTGFISQLLRMKQRREELMEEMNRIALCGSSISKDQFKWMIFAKLANSCIAKTSGRNIDTCLDDLCNDSPTANERNKDCDDGHCEARAGPDVSGCASEQMATCPPAAEMAEEGIKASQVGSDGASLPDGIVPNNQKESSVTTSSFEVMLGGNGGLVSSKIVSIISFE